MNTLFLPHGAPTFALSPGPAGEAMTAFANASERPKAILVVSAHWNTFIPTVGTSTRPATLHDYWGFPEALRSIRYGVRGAPDLAGNVMALLDAAGMKSGTDEKRGLDHGAWIPLRMMYPDASIPVAPLSIQYRCGPEHHFRVGRALSRLAGEGILVIASGNLTHNLGDYGSRIIPSYVSDFRQWMKEMLETGNLDALLDYRRKAPGAELAHPTEEHLLPLFVALGASGGKFMPIYEGVYDGAIAMDAYSFQ